MGEKGEKEGGMGLVGKLEGGVKGGCVGGRWGVLAFLVCCVSVVLCGQSVCLRVDVCACCCSVVLCVHQLTLRGIKTCQPARRKPKMKS